MRVALRTVGFSIRRLFCSYPKLPLFLGSRDTHVRRIECFQSMQLCASWIGSGETNATTTCDVFVETKSSEKGGNSHHSISEKLEICDLLKRGLRLCTPSAAVPTDYKTSFQGSVFLVGVLGVLSCWILSPGALFLR